MSDIELTLNGDASGAVGAFTDTAGATQELANETGKATVKWQEMANVAKKAAEAVVKFGIDAVKAYAESERVQKQLTRAAGEYADALGEQAEALSKKYAVDDDIIKQSQVLLTQWGGVGAATEDVTKAVLNYAAATGQDAVSATSDLIRNVESGGAGLAKMGVHFESTGQKGHDLAAAVGALNKKFGGAALADAESLTGSIHAASLAFEDLQKDLGESIAGFLQETGAVGALTQAMRSLQEFMGQKQTNKLFDEGFRMGEWVNAQKKLVDMQNELAAAKRDGAAPSIIALFEEDVRNAQAAVDKLKASAAPLVPGLGDVAGVTNKGRKDSATQAKQLDELALKNEKSMRDFQNDWDDLDLAVSSKSEKAYADELQRSAERVDIVVKEGQDKVAAMQLFMAKELDFEREREKQYAEMQHKALMESQERMKRKEEESRRAGDAIGSAFVNALADQLAKLAEGGEFDAALFVGDILATAVSVAAGVIGTAYGMPALGAAVGNLAATGIRAGSSALSKNAKKAKTTKQYHDGGWVGADGLPRYHDGAWIGSDEQAAVLQTGERVLSRQEVHHMGGQQGVERAVRGGAGVVVNIQAIDSKSAAESFERDLAEGMRKAQLAGRGMLPALLGAGPR